MSNEVLVGRFTPTRVGTTDWRKGLAISSSVHPHARGDNEAALYQLRERLRFTPTRVGTTLKFLLLFLDANQQ